MDESNINRERERGVYGYGLAYWAAPLVEKDITPKGLEYRAPVYRDEDEIFAIERGWHPIRILTPLFPTHQEANRLIQGLVDEVNALDVATDYGRKDFKFVAHPTDQEIGMVNLARWLTEVTLGQCGPGTGRPFNMIQERFVIIGLSPGQEYLDVRTDRPEFFEPLRKQPLRHD